MPQACACLGRNRPCACLGRNRLSQLVPRRLWFRTACCGHEAGVLAVIGFFGISGYLIMMSRLSHRNALTYYRARFLRIMPGLAVCLALVAFVVAPVSAALTGRSHSWADSLIYVFRHVTFWGTQESQPDMPGTLIGLPDEDQWNGSLWTL
ncbi:acyltransferase family protein [Pseudarthrobacter sp. N5]|uniref:acyltransferase family protein n=1 Tax=Pseudarthrobacter sp. N5 TaxID=3418416 RepID=UPI003CF5A053